MATISLGNIESLVLAKVGSKIDDADVTPGTHTFDFTVRVSGSLTRAEDTVKTPTSRGLTKAAIGLFIQRSGMQRDLAIEILMGAMRDAALLDKKAEAALMKVIGVDAAVERLDAELAHLPKTPVKGAVKINEKTLVIASVDLAVMGLAAGHEEAAAPADTVEEAAAPAAE